MIFHLFSFSSLCVYNSQGWIYFCEKVCWHGKTCLFRAFHGSTSISSLFTEMILKLFHFHTNSIAIICCESTFLRNRVPMKFDALHNIHKNLATIIFQSIIDLSTQFALRNWRCARFCPWLHHIVIETSLGLGEHMKHVITKHDWIVKCFSLAAVFFFFVFLLLVSSQTVRNIKTGKKCFCRICFHS